MNITCPTEDRLKSLIMEAFDELPAPDPAHIEQIASTLANKTKKQRNQGRKHRQHWLFWVLLGGSMTAAAWWGSSYLLPKQAKPPVQIELEKGAPEVKPVLKEPFRNNATELHEQAPTQGSSSKTSPIIDKREQY